MRRRSLLKGIANVAAAWRAGLPGRIPRGETRIAPPSDRLALLAEPAAPSTETPTAPSLNSSPPNFADYATIEAMAGGEPVYGLDYMAYIYSIGPDLMPGLVMQEGNTQSPVKIRPKKSWEIKHNLLGSNTAQHPRSPANDFQTFSPIHLIDGDSRTAWCSFGSIEPDVHPEWIRIDLPIESTVACVALVLTKTSFAGTNFGRSLPRELTVKLSRDAWHWETVYAHDDVNIDTPDRLPIRFKPRRAKQIWVIGNNFEKPLGLPDHGFSVGDLEVLDPSGKNLALVSRGAGVMVSSTNFTHGDNRLTQNSLWGPLHYDSGTKWVRQCGGAAGPYQWRLIEKERGKYEVDPVLDHWLTDLHRCGINSIMGLDITQGNPLYQNPPKLTNWLEARWNDFPDTQGWVDQTPEMLDAWLRFVNFLVRHFKDRAYIWELGNEWSGCGWDDQIVARYMKIFDKTYEAVKKADPAARVMPGAINAFAPDCILTLLGGERRSGLHDAKLVANGGNIQVLESSTLALPENVTVRDAEVSVNALNRGQFGILLRYSNPQSFLMGAYGTCMPGLGAYVVYIAERVGDAWDKSRITAVDIGWPFSLNLRLKMRVEGTTATFTVSDGKREATVTHNIQAEQLNRSGSVGLIQLTGADQAFGNFQVHDLEGGVDFREPFQGETGAVPAGWKYVFGPHAHNPFAPGLAQKIDGLSWHPTNPPDAVYFDAVRQMQKQCRQLGFKGRFYADELFFFFSYPPTKLNPLSELQQGIATMISVVGHSGLDTLAETQILHYTGYSGSDSNCRQSWPSQIAVPVQPSVMYYMWRNLATVMDDFHPAEFPVKFDGNEKLLWFTFQRRTAEKLLAVWIDNAWTNPGIVETRSAIRLPGTRAERAWVVDLMNGTEQELELTQNDGSTVIPGIRIKNYPTIIRFVQ
jgi:hypothetical protein